MIPALMDILVVQRSQRLSSIKGNMGCRQMDA